MNWRAKKSLIWLFAAVLVLVCAVNFVEFVPLIIFLSYLIYGLVRPWISRKWRREIEDGLDDEILEEELAAGPLKTEGLPEEPST